jgi:hypothetical protein
MMRKSWMMAIALGCTAMTAGCHASTPAVRMVASGDVPAAQGPVKAKSTHNGNTALEVEVRHLALPERVNAGATTYVVWARGLGEAEFHNLGALRVDADLRGTLKTVTPLRTFDVMITAEPSPTAMFPSRRKLLTASIQGEGG